MRWLRERAQAFPTKSFLNGLTFKEVYDQALLLSARMDFWLQGSHRVALCAENSPAMVTHLFALWLLGKEVLLLNTQLTASEFNGQTVKLGITKVICSPAQKAARQESVPEGTTLYEFFKIPLLSPSARANLIPDLERRLPPEPSDSTIAAIMNTSATTGAFKSVPLRWGQIEAHVKASAQVLGVQADDNWLAVLPIFHVSGLSIVMRSLYNGTAVSILPKFSADEVLMALNSNRITMVSLVPTVLQRIVNDIHSDKLRVILLGGEFIPAALIEASLAKGLPIYKTYGMTETFAQSATVSLVDHPDKRDSVGYPLPGVSFEVRNADKDGIGEVWVSTPTLMWGYLEQEPIEGPFNTDDVGYVDDDGYLYIVNRRKDIIISGGENIYPKELEDCLYRLDGVRECAVVPVQDDYWGQIPVLFYAGDVTEDSVRDHMLASLAKYKVPKRIHRLEALPRNGSGKIVRRALTEPATETGEMTSLTDGPSNKGAED